MARRDPARRWSGDALQSALAALASPQRLRILAALCGGPVHVSELARRVSLSRPLVHMHLQRLEKAGLIRGHLELSEDRKALKYFDVEDFSILLTPAAVAEAVVTLSEEAAKPSGKKRT